ncbi:MAG: Ldh family oxidoreductase [Planctomycetes bacterium]|nr:Ldh family oxidoreductase [Planctomycetota bacterium]
MPVITADKLLAFAAKLLEAGGAGAAEARVVAESLVGANLRGHDSHGVMRIPFYVAGVKSGVLQPDAHLVVERERPAALVCDGGWGFGQVVSRELTERLIDKAAEAGVACGTLKRSAHIGRLGEYAELAAERGMAALVCANTHGAAQRVAPVGGKRPRLGTNPLCLGMPGGAEGPFVLDFGTSATAEGKVRVKKIAGQPVPEGWILDPEGRPTTDPNQLYGDPPGTILPMGGPQAYKGFGLAFLIEMLCGGLSGGQCAYENPPPPLGNCALFVVFAPEQLGGAAHLADEVARLEKYVRGVPRIDGVKDITLPGDPERRVLVGRSRGGIPLDEGNWRALVALAGELDVSPPETETA